MRRSLSFSEFSEPGRFELSDADHEQRAVLRHYFHYAIYAIQNAQIRPQVSELYFFEPSEWQASVKSASPVQ